MLSENFPCRVRSGPPSISKTPVLHTKRKDWIKQLVQGDAVGAATKEAVQAAQAAMMVATMAASSAAMTSR